MPGNPGHAFPARAGDEADRALTPGVCDLAGPPNHRQRDKMRCGDQKIES